MKHIRIQHPLRLLIYTVVLFFGSVSAVFAQGDYQPLTGIPGVTDTNLSLAGYVNALFLISIAVGALLAVIKIAIAGLKYMLSEIVTDKSEARKDITGALLGLGILLAAVIVLGTINPNLVNLNILGGATQLDLPGNDDSPSGSSGEALCGDSGEYTPVRQPDDSPDGFAIVCRETNPPESPPIYEPDAIPDTPGAVVDSVTLQGHSEAEQAEIETLFRENCNTWGGAVGEGRYETSKSNGVLTCYRAE